MGYADTDYSGFLVDRKRTLGMRQFLGSCLVSSATKDQNSVVLSTFEGCILIFCDNTSAISMTKNPVHHKRTYHTDVRHHLLRDNYENGLITVEFCTTDKQISDIFKKALSRDHFERNMLELGMIKII